MTVTNADRERFRSTVEEFTPQHLPDMCLTAALKNIIDELASRHGVDELSMSISDLNDICDYRAGMGASSQNLPSKLNPVLNEVGYNAQVAIGIGLDDLASIIKDESRSYPIVDLDESYFESIDRYNPDHGTDGFQWTHVVVPFTVNTESILFYDPFHEILMRSSGRENPPVERPQTQFYEWWSAPETRWTLWIQREGQRTLTSPEFTGGYNGDE